MVSSSPHVVGVCSGRGNVRIDLLSTLVHLQHTKAAECLVRRPHYLTAALLKPYECGNQICVESFPWNHKWNTRWVGYNVLSTNPANGLMERTGKRWHARRPSRTDSHFRNSRQLDRWSCLMCGFTVSMSLGEIL